MAVPGLKVVAPAFPADVKGLMAAAIRDHDPVLFFEQKSLYATKGEVPDGEHYVPLGKANVVREGSDVTIVALAADGAARAQGRGHPQRAARHRRDRDRPALARAARHADDPARGREDRPARDRGREPAALRLGRRDRRRSWRRSCSGTSTGRSCGSRHRTCRSRPRTTSRTSRSRTPTRSSPACASSSIDCTSPIN